LEIEGVFQLSGILENRGKSHMKNVSSRFGEENKLCEKEEKLATKY
jgi:hypothetical protein